jgi:hypothetical protein
MGSSISGARVYQGVALLSLERRSSLACRMIVEGKLDVQERYVCKVFFGGLVIGGWRHHLGHEEAVAGWSLYVQIVTYHSYRL